MCSREIGETIERLADFLGRKRSNTRLDSRGHGRIPFAEMRDTMNADVAFVVGGLLSYICLFLSKDNS